LTVDEDRRGEEGLLKTDEMDSDGLGRLSLLASALSGRALQVAPGEPGEPAWTDGRMVFVDAYTSTRDQLEALVVQASLLAAGSLEPDVVCRLTRRPALAKRYLAIEGQRALAANEHLLPLPMRSLIDDPTATRGLLEMIDVYLADPPA
jgi:nitric oxide reductase NorD protein